MSRLRHPGHYNTTTVNSMRSVFYAQFTLLSPNCTLSKFEFQKKIFRRSIFWRFLIKLFNVFNENVETTAWQYCNMQKNSFIPSYSKMKLTSLVVMINQFSVSDTHSLHISSFPTYINVIMITSVHRKQYKTTVHFWKYSIYRVAVSNIFSVNCLT